MYAAFADWGNIVLWEFMVSIALRIVKVPGENSAELRSARPTLHLDPPYGDCSSLVRCVRYLTELGNIVIIELSEEGTRCPDFEDGETTSN